MLNENEVFDRIRCITGPDEGFGYEEGDNETLFVIQETSIKNRYKFFVIDKDLNYVIKESNTKSCPKCSNKNNIDAEFCGNKAYYGLNVNKNVVLNIRIA